MGAAFYLKLAHFYLSRAEYFSQTSAFSQLVVISTISAFSNIFHLFTKFATCQRELTSENYVLSSLRLPPRGRHSFHTFLHVFSRLFQKFFRGALPTAGEPRYDYRLVTPHFYLRI